MTLAALIIACETADGEREALRATLPLLGRTLVEYQARAAARLGATQIVVLVARVPPALVAALDRLRREGLRIDVARSLADAADRVHPEERLLLIGDGWLVELPMLARLLGKAPPAVLVLDDEPGRADLERIDAGSRWAGASLVDGKALRRTAAMLGDWDAQSTLLRSAIQGGAARIDASGGTPPRLLRRVEEAAAAGQGLARIGGASGRRWPSRLLYAPLARAAARLLVSRPFEAVWVAAGGAALCVAATPCAALGWTRTALALLLASGPLAALADRLAALRLARPRWRSITEAARLAGGLGGVAGVARGLAAAGQWGWWLVAALIPVGLAGLASAERLRTPVPATPLADLNGLAWLFLAGFLVDGPGVGLAAAAAYALASFAAAQAALVRRSPAWREV